MLNLKKFYSDELLQIALLLSLMRVDPDSYLGIDMQTVNVGSLDLNNGSNWNNDAHHTIIHRPAFVHPKNLDSILLNYERDLFEDLNALGRYNIINNARNDIHAYLLNVNETAGPSVVVTETAENARNSNSPDPPMPTQTADDSLRAAELTQEVEKKFDIFFNQTMCENNLMHGV